MSKNNYERYADIEQPKALTEHSDVTLKQAIDYLKGCKTIFSDDVFSGVLMAFAYIFQRDISELEKLIDKIEIYISNSVKRLK